MLFKVVNGRIVWRHRPNRDMMRLQRMASAAMSDDNTHISLAFRERKDYNRVRIMLACWGRVRIDDRMVNITISRDFNTFDELIAYIANAGGR